MSVELKALRPVQKIISATLMKPWCEIENQYGEEVSPLILRRFIVSSKISKEWFCEAIVNVSQMTFQYFFAISSALT